MLSTLESPCPQSEKRCNDDGLRRTRTDFAVLILWGLGKQEEFITKARPDSWTPKEPWMLFVGQSYHTDRKLRLRRRKPNEDLNFVGSRKLRSAIGLTHGAQSTEVTCVGSELSNGQLVSSDSSRSPLPQRTAASGKQSHHRYSNHDPSS